MNHPFGNFDGKSRRRCYVNQQHRQVDLREREIKGDCTLITNLTYN